VQLCIKPIRSFRSLNEPNDTKEDNKYLHYLIVLSNVIILNHSQLSQTRNS